MEPGQIIATSHGSFTPKGSSGTEMGPLISGKFRLVKYYSWPDGTEMAGKFFCSVNLFIQWRFFI